MPKAVAQSAVRDQGDQPGRDPARHTRSALLDATATAIARNGWSAITTRQVAALAGVNPALVHYHFGSMDELRRQAAVKAMAEEIAGPMGALLADTPLPAAIATCVEAVARIDPGSDRFALLYEAMLEAGRDPYLQAVMEEAYDGFRAALVDRIRAAGGRDPEAAAVVIAATLDGVLLHRLVKPGLDVRRLTSTIVAALQLPDARSAGPAVSAGPNQHVRAAGRSQTDTKE